MAGVDILVIANFPIAPSAENSSCRVLCELTDVALLPEGIRALPRVDLTQGRMVDYLALKEVLTQAGSQIGRVAVVDPVRRTSGNLHGRSCSRRSLRLLMAALLLGALAAIWFWVL